MERLRCPVCRAKFRAARCCSRCGADLAPLMILAEQARRSRNEARAAIQRGDLILAVQSSGEAQALCSSERGRRLELLCRWLADRSD
jgi:hypothetical protein